MATDKATAQVSRIGRADEAPQAANSSVMQAATERMSRLTDEQMRMGRDMAARATHGVDTLMQVQTVVNDGLQTLWKEWMSYTQDSMQRWSEQAQTLAKVRTMQDLVNAQTDMIKVEMEELLRSSQRITELATETAGTLTRQITERTEAAAREMRPGA
ncbi:MAG TPA: phasin family protein [Azospirillaceae bacterium]|nr:phasin family protein [Azospirillaceae bacterium]